MSQATLDQPVYEVYAVRYAHMARRRADNFLGGDPHEGPMPMDFFVWLIRSQSRCILVDTGFNAQTAEARQRDMLQCPIEALAALNVQPEDITDVILTHLHYDHAGNLDKLPNARFHIQDAEVEFATGRCMCHGAMRHAYSVEDVVQLVRKVYDERVIFHDGDSDLFEGIRLLQIGGHTKGLQSVQVATARGTVVLASDASHYYENMERSRPFPIVFNVADMLQGYVKLNAAAESPDHIVPGHDPRVLEIYPPLNSTHPDIVQLHLPPRSPLSETL